MKPRIRAYSAEYWRYMYEQSDNLIYCVYIKMNLHRLINKAP